MQYRVPVLFTHGRPISYTAGDVFVAATLSRCDSPRFARVTNGVAASLFSIEGLTSGLRVAAAVLPFVNRRHAKRGGVPVAGRTPSDLE